MTPSNGTIVLTGSNGGLGSAIASQIAYSADLSQHHGVFIARNAERAPRLNGILAGAPSSFKHDVVSIDLSSLTSVREGAKAINARVASGSLPPIRALIISAGFQELTTQTFSDDGFDMTFQVNYLAQFLLVLLLLQSIDKDHGRIVIVSGLNHDTADVRNEMSGIYKDEKYKVLYHTTDALAKGTWSTPADDPSSMSGQRRYGAAHLLEVMFLRELEKRLSVDPALSKISVLGLDPGAMPTDICRRDGFLVRVLFMKIIMPLINPISVHFQPNGLLRTTTKSASDALRLAFDTETLGEHPRGVYVNGTEPWPVSKEAENDGNLETLWKDSIKYANVVKEDTALLHWD